MSDFNVSYPVGGEIDKIKEVAKVKGLASKSIPYNTMQMFSIPAREDDFEYEINLPQQDVEIVGVTVTCSGYGEKDCFDIIVNDHKWYDNWYTAEVKESLLAGTLTYVYEVPKGTVIKLVFKNHSGTSKLVWFGLRMLID